MIYHLWMRLKGWKFKPSGVIRRDGLHFALKSGCWTKQKHGKLYFVAEMGEK